MLRVTRWSPDTCDCVLEYEWDDAEPENTRVHKFKAMVVKCPAHLNLPPKDQYNQVVLENTRKNKVFAKAKKIKPELTPDDYKWSFDTNRKLKVNFKGKMVGAEKKQLKDLCDIEFGLGKVEVA